MFEADHVNFPGLYLNAPKTRKFQHYVFVAGFADALAELAQKTLFKSILSSMHLAAFGRPVYVARWYLGYREKRSAAVAQIGQARGTPDFLLTRLVLVNYGSSDSYYH